MSAVGVLEVVAVAVIVPLAMCLARVPFVSVTPAGRGGLRLVLVLMEAADGATTAASGASSEGVPAEADLRRQVSLSASAGGDHRLVQLVDVERVVRAGVGVDRLLVVGLRPEEVGLEPILAHGESWNLINN